MTDAVTLPVVTIVGQRAAPTDDLTLVVNGRSWSGWTDVRVTRGIERLPSDFEVQLTEFSPVEKSIQILRGDVVELLAGPDLLMTGYVDRIVRSLDAHAHGVTITGRSKCADLVDCAAEWKGGQIKGSNVLEIAQNLAAPYNIDVRSATAAEMLGVRTVVAGSSTPAEVAALVQASVGPPIPQFNLARGESPFQIIERLCRFGQLLAYDEPDGGLVLTPVLKLAAASGFREGVNVIRATFAATMDQRYSEYESYLQSTETFDDLGTGGDSQAIIFDNDVPRHRRRILICETSGKIGWEIAAQRAGWEAKRRKGRSCEVRITTDSWRDSSGRLYTPNTLALVELPTLGIPSARLTIGEVTYRSGSSGTLCDIVLMPPDAFTPQPFNVLQLLPFAELAGIALPPKAAP